MALNRGYKLQEFVAHASDVKCVAIGKKSSKIFITGGEDRKVNLWAFGKSTPLLSLSGHMGSVESVAFDSAEVLVLGGSSNGIIKLWDLEEAKIVRTLTGHRSNCTSVEFHPFGEFFASGSLDTDLKIWDIRKKGCIHTYKGHTGGIRKIRFTPDGRWVVTGGADNTVKLWDLTAGKLLHDFKFHNGQIRCIDFHPHEFLLATGSADRTVKFWDLETFELIGSAGPEATEVCSMIFHPDGKTLFCGLDATLKVFSWEPIRCHDVVDMGWSTLGDLSIYEGKLLGCSYYESRIGVWVADISLIAPYALGVVPKVNGIAEPTYVHGEDHSLELKESSIKSNITPTCEYEEIGTKTKELEKGPCLTSDDSMQSITPGNNSVYTSNPPPMTMSGVRRNKISGSCITGPQRFGSRISSKASTPNSTTSTAVKSIQGSLNSSNRSEHNLPSRNNVLTSSTSRTISLVSMKKGPSVQSQAPVSMPIIVPRDNKDQDSFRIVTTSSQVNSQGLRSNRSAHKHKPLLTAGDIKGQVTETSSASLSDRRSNSDVANLKLNAGLPHEAEESDKGEQATTRNIADKFERVMSIEQSAQSQNDNNGVELSCSSSETNSVKYVRGVAVQLGKTRTLVERWERREIGSSSSMTINGSGQTTEKDLTTAEDDSTPETLVQNHDAFVNTLKSRLTKLQMVQHFWIQNGIKGAISSMAKLPDFPVQVDVISILKEKNDIFTLDLFSIMLPLLVALLNSKVERHIIVSLSLLLELVKIFKPVITSTITASSSVGVDLQAEQRQERCTQCFSQLEKIKQILPPLIRRGGSLAKHAGELNIILHES
ncbi:katanin p80 WD40 repeat-containing subunit [Canna indica]|uniref:Katanin p80 WD40 repeat-containing subunit B1 homolog n=1 Tax=Canna indica TaxID=4628 RepID=A0AAQ3KQP8_9LILI|nr:katanin p80 WD40 repeat-containing subunit [Canna indica]